MTSNIESPRLKDEETYDIYCFWRVEFIQFHVCDVSYATPRLSIIGYITTEVKRPQSFSGVVM